MMGRDLLHKLLRKAGIWFQEDQAKENFCQSESHVEYGQRPVGGQWHLHGLLHSFLIQVRQEKM